ncbi:hypothetical protein BgiMline_020695 [Biomphalaria glabrata]
MSVHSNHFNNNKYTQTFGLGFPWMLIECWADEMFVVFIESRHSTTGNITMDNPIVSRGHCDDDKEIAEANCHTQTRSLHSDSCSHLYGAHETQVLENGEVDLKTYLNNCKKNPGHTNFISLDQFNITHLPEGFNDEDLYRFTRALADLTVRVSVQMISPLRPQFLPGTSVPYPFCNQGGVTSLRTGTGVISSVEKYSSGLRSDRCWHWKNATHCWCKDCQRSSSPSNVWWEIVVETAAHVVYNDTEASHTSLRLFYDTDKSLVVTLDTVTALFVNVERDTCALNCATCNKDLGDQLEKVKKTFFNLLSDVYIKYRKSRDENKLAIIVSHPHGCPKQVSIGHWLKKHLDNNKEYLKFTYTASTCPGSSGAIVYCVGYGSWWRYHLIHSGTKGREENYSGMSSVSI